MSRRTTSRRERWGAIASVCPTDVPCSTCTRGTPGAHRAPSQPFVTTTSGPAARAARHADAESTCGSAPMRYVQRETWWSTPTMVVSHAGSPSAALSISACRSTPPWRVRDSGETRTARIRSRLVRERVPRAPDEEGEHRDHRQLVEEVVEQPLREQAADRRDE